MCRNALRFFPPFLESILPGGCEITLPDGVLIPRPLQVITEDRAQNCKCKYVIHAVQAATRTTEFVKLPLSVKRVTVRCAPRFCTPKDHSLSTAFFEEIH